MGRLLNAIVEEKVSYRKMGMSKSFILAVPNANYQHDLHASCSSQVTHPHRKAAAFAPGL
jgi:hypothetical protein